MKNKRIPKVVITGIPNVGKSTLFNRLCGRKKAIVHREAGMTRDSIREKVFYNGRVYVLVDTGGVFEEKDNFLLKKVKQRVIDEVKDSDLVLFVFDSKREILPIEEELFVDIKKTGKKILIVLNKVDNERDLVKIAYYEKFNREVVPISAEHKKGIDDLQERIVETINAPKIEEENKDKIKVLFTGKTNVGKSSLLNAIIGDERFIVSNIQHTTRDVIDEEIELGDKTYILVDSAGLRKLRKLRDSKEKAGVIKTKKSIKYADVVCFIVSPDLSITREDLNIAREIERNKKPVIIIVNKKDLFRSERDIVEFEKLLREKLFFLYYAPIIFVSSIEGKKLGKIFKKINEVYNESRKNIKTQELNDFLGEVVSKKPMISRDGIQLNPKYITQVGISPPKFMIFTKKRGVPSEASLRFFEKKLRERFKFSGTPIVFLFKHN